jgi:hypothetical protein
VNGNILNLLIMPALVFALSMLPPSFVSAESDTKAKLPRITRELLLFAKNPATWAIVKGGGKGKIIYCEATGAFTLSAKGLPPHTSYALVRYADQPPSVEVLVRGATNGRGSLVLTGTWRNWTKKFWVVSDEDVTGSPGEVGSLQAWRPDRYLFEEKQLGIPCKCRVGKKL